MRCETVEIRLPDLAMDDLSSRDEVWITTHLHKCVDCQDRLERERDVALLLREWSEPDFAEVERIELRSNVRAAIEAESIGLRRSGTTQHLVVAASIAAVALLLGLAVIDRVGGPKGNDAIAGPATRIEDTEPGVFAMFGPFSAKEKIEPRKPGDKSRRAEQKPRRAVRRVSQPQRSSPASSLQIGAVDSDSMMRFEFQTQDPKIRIIWFVPRAEEETPASSDIGD